MAVVDDGGFSTNGQKAGLLKFRSILGAIVFLKGGSKRVCIDRGEDARARGIGLIDLQIPSPL
jgi:hypothetical protein